MADAKKWQKINTVPMVTCNVNVETRNAPGYLNWCLSGGWASRWASRWAAAKALLTAVFVLLFATITTVAAAQSASTAPSAMPKFGAIESAWVGDPAIAEARLISAVTGTGDLGALLLGLELRTAPGWKVYWRTPGEAGLPPMLDFTTMAVPVTAKMDWPAPKRFSAFGFDNFGYETHVILPLTVRGHVPGGVVQLAANLEALACAEICVPIFGALALTLSDGPAIPSFHARAIAEYQAKVPRPADAMGRSASGPSLLIEAAEYADDMLYLTLAEGAPAITDVFVEGFDQIAFKAPQITGRVLEILVLPSKGHGFVGGAATITVLAGPEAAEFAVNITPRSPSDDQPASGLSLWAVGIALLGGLILNLMPCVLPVLALKLSAVLASAGAERRELRWRFVAGAAGILTSFMMLAAALAAVKIAGGRIGWGIQFQNVYFLGAMVVLLGVFAANMLGLFHFRTPAFAAAVPMPGRGGISGRLVGDFLSGMLATILATPCSAPFVGTAVTIAFSGSMGDLFGVFAAMGVGLAAPWLLVAAFPGLMAFLPKPGAWMDRLRQLLALLLVGTMLWLGSVIYNVLGLGAAGTPAEQSSAQQYQAWEPALVAALVADGKTVFVDVTADWCITCKANKALVLDQDPLASILAAQVAAGDLVMLQADWTRPSEAIAVFLAGHGRYGIPFNVLYSNQLAAPYILPEILTTDAMLTGLENAGILPK